MYGLHQIILGLTKLILEIGSLWCDMEVRGQGKMILANMQPWIEDTSWKTYCISENINKIYPKVG